MSLKRILRETVSVNEAASTQNSPSKSSISSIYMSPRNFYRVRDEGETKSSRSKCSPDRSNEDESADRSLQDRPVDKTLGHREIERGRSLIREDNHATFDQQQISSKIETLDQAKSNEQKQDAVHEQSSKKAALTIGKDNINSSNPPDESSFSRYVRKKSSKVAAMSKLFDNGSVTRFSVTITTPPRHKPVFSTSSPFVEQSRTLNSGGIRKALTPQPLPSHSISKRNSIVSPRTVREPMTTYTTKNSLTKPRTNASHQEKSLQKKPLAAKAQSVNEKVQLFESARASQESVLGRKRSRFVRKLSRSLKSLFEPPSTRRNEEQARQERGLNDGQLQAIIDEVQETSKSAKVGKRTNTIVGRWNTASPGPVTNGCDGAVSENGIGSPSAAEVQEMVVKEAECGLKEPKPVRVAEVKRMMLICKERFGDMMDKEKVQGRKF